MVVAECPATVLTLLRVFPTRLAQPACIRERLYSERIAATANTVLYEYAQAPATGEVVHIGDFSDVHGPATCLGCDSPMIAKRGSKTRWHFAHHKDAACAPETALHRGACLMIEQGFVAAKSSNTAYEIGWFCKECKEFR